MSRDFPCSTNPRSVNALADEGSFGTLPTFLVIGSMKCGTTSLHDYLARHPDVFMSAVKEVNFFVLERTWDKGIDWYRAQFYGRYQVRGEASQNYTKRHEFEPGVAERIRSLLPNVKLIYIVRDPVARFVPAAGGERGGLCH